MIFKRGISKHDFRWIVWENVWTLEVNTTICAFGQESHYHYYKTENTYISVSIECRLDKNQVNGE